jgi:predicted ATP-dependent endonuclease of OLD family
MKVKELILRNYKGFGADAPPISFVDEMELHLHPPLQQALVRALPKLGRNNQFIITTHSDDVVGMFGVSEVIRLDNQVLYESIQTSAAEL